MKELKHDGFVYSVELESGRISFHFKNQDDALVYCKTNYANTLFQIVPVPVFTFKDNDAKLGEEKEI